LHQGGHSLSFRLIEGGVPSTPCAAPARSRAALLLQAADGSRQTDALKLGHALQAIGDGEGSVPERAFRDHARDPLLLADRARRSRSAAAARSSPSTYE